MRSIGWLSGVLLLVSAVGCTTAYSVKLDGDVQGADKDTPRAVKADVHWASEARAARAAGGNHLHALTKATVTVQLKFKGVDKPRSQQTVTVDSQTAQFHYEASGESKDGALEGVVVGVKCDGHEPVERMLAAAPEVPFEETVMAVLEEVGPGGATAAAPAPAPAPAPAASPAPVDSAKAASAPAGK